jgi:hypothetical protein
MLNGGMGSVNRLIPTPVCGRRPNVASYGQVALPRPTMNSDEGDDPKGIDIAYLLKQQAPRD